jgi:hypothetical protein
VALVSIGIVTVGHKNPDLYGRTILSLLVNTVSFRDKSYYIGLNSPEDDLSDRIHEFCECISQVLPIDIHIITFTDNPGLYGFSKCVHNIISNNLQHDYYIQLAYDVLSITNGVDDIIVNTHKELSQYYNVGFVAPFTNINEYCAPYYAELFPGSEFQNRSKAVGIDGYLGGQHPIFEPPVQEWCWRNSNLLEQEVAIRQGLITKLNASLPFSCSMIAFTKEAFLTFGDNYYYPDGEEPAWWMAYKDKSNGIVVDTNAYVGHFCYFPAYEHIHDTNTHLVIYDKIDEIIRMRIKNSEYRDSFNHILNNTYIGSKINARI